MTEEIIIDGVNVAGCYWKCKDGDCAMYYADLSADNNELEFGFNCEDNPDCYFKQLQRLKQENEKLKEDYRKATEMSIEKLTVSVEAEAYHRMKQALKEIRKIADKFDFWNNNLPEASEIIGEIIDKINEVLNDTQTNR